MNQRAFDRETYRSGYREGAKDAYQAAFAAGYHDGYHAAYKEAYAQAQADLQDPAFYSPMVEKQRLQQQSQPERTWLTQQMPTQNEH